MVLPFCKFLNLFEWIAYEDALVSKDHGFPVEDHFSVVLVVKNCLSVLTETSLIFRLINYYYYNENVFSH